MEVTAHPIRTRRTDRFLKRITHLGLVGDFHSHTKVPIDKASSIRLSRKDKESMSMKNLGIVIAINKDKGEAQLETSS